MVSTSSLLQRWRYALALTTFVAGFHGGLWLLYQDLRSTGQAGRGESLARLSERTDDVQRREAESFLWSFTEAGEHLFRGDALRVGAHGSALLELSGGRTLELGPNSLVVIEQWKDLPLRFLEGSFFLRSPTGEKHITLDRHGRVRIEDVAVRLLKPESLATILTAPFTDALVEMEWKGDPRSGPAPILEISSRRLFHGRTLQRHAVTPEGNISLRLAPGTYWWRLADGTKALSAVRMFQVSEKRPLLPTVPTAGKAVIGERVGFRWRAPENAVGAHRLVVSRDAKFSSLVIDHAVSADREAATLTLEPGRYFWALRSRWRGLEWMSDVQEFSVEAPHHWKLGAIVPSIGDAAELGKSLTFAWTVEGGDPGRLTYTLEIAPPSGDPVSIRRKGATNAAWTPTVAGAHRWRIRAEGLEKPLESSWRALTIFDGQPIALQSPYNGERLERWRPEPLELKWQEIAIKRYRVEIAGEPTFTKPIAFQIVTSPAWRAPALPFGSYYWRVIALDDNWAIQRKSPLGRFETVGLPSLPPPAAITATNGKKIVLSWSAISAAKSYVVRVRLGEKIVRNMKVVKTEYTVPNLPDGEYDWQVATVDPVGRTGEFSPLSRLKIEKPKSQARAKRKRR